MKAVMISIQPEWCAMIANFLKTIEVRKDFPKLETPFKCYIYCTKRPPYLVLGDVFRGNWETEYTTTRGYSREEADRIWGTLNGKVIGEFICDKISTYPYVEDDSDPGVWRYEIPTSEGERTGLKYDDFTAYGKGQTLYGWHIADLKIYGVYDELLEITQFIKPCPYDEVCECCDEYFELEDCCKNAALQVRRPPQSWFYVEEGVFSA